MTALPASDAQRAPTSLLRFVDVFVLRAAARTLSALLFQPPPRFTRA